jgi:hypothetical protein
MNVRLYELTGKYRSLELLEESDDLPAEVIRDTLEGLEGDIQEKATNVGLFVRNLDSVADSIDEAAEKMGRRAVKLRKRAQSLRDYLLLNMQACGISKIQSPYFTLSVRNNPPSVVVDNAEEIPEEYKRTPPPAPPPVAVPDKAKIAKAIKNGEEVPGAHSEQGQRLEISL